MVRTGEIAYDGKVTFYDALSNSIGIASVPVPFEYAKY